MQNRQNSTMTNYFFNLLGTAWEAATDIAIIALIARHLNLSLFGDYAFVMAFVAAFTVMCGLSMPAIITREIAVDKRRAPQLLTSSLFIQCVMSLLTILVVSLTINVIHDDPSVIQATYLAIMAVVADFLGLLFVSVARGYERMEYATYRTVISQTVFLGLVCLLFLTAEQSFINIFFFFLIARLAGLVYAAVIVMRKFVKPAVSLDMKLCRYLFLEAYPIALRRFVRRIGFRIDTIILNFLRGSAEAGLFHGAYKIMQGLMFIGEGLVVSVFPVMSRHYVNSRDSLDGLYERSFRFLSVSGVFLGIILFSFSGELIALVLGEKYLAAEPVLQVFSVLVLFMFLSKLSERMLIVGRRQLIATLIAAVALVINVALDLVLIPVLGVVGASVATLFAEGVLLALGLYYTHRHVSETPAHICILKSTGVFCLAIFCINIGDAYFGSLGGFCCGFLVAVIGIVSLGLLPLVEIGRLKNEIFKAMRLEPRASR